MQINSRVEVNAGKEEVFRFLANPKNIESVYPKELDFKILNDINKIYEDAEIWLEARLLGKKFRWKSIIRYVNEPYEFLDEAEGSPFLYWRHYHIVEEYQERCVIKDKIEFSIILSIADIFASKAIKSILEYRNSMIKKLFGYNERYISYKDPTRLSILNGSIIITLSAALGLIIPYIIPSGNILGD